MSDPNREQDKELTEEELKKAAGGRGRHGETERDGADGQADTAGTAPPVSDPLNP